MRVAEAVFVDTNVLLYAVDVSDPAKQQRAREWLRLLWEKGMGRLSWQVLNEFYANALRKNRASSPEAKALVEAYASWQPVGFSLGPMQRSWHWMAEAQISHWDGLIVAAAEQAGCGRLLSEDFQAGRKLGSVTVVNPFRSRSEGSQ